MFESPVRSGLLPSRPSSDAQPSSKLSESNVSRCLLNSNIASAKVDVELEEAFTKGTMGVALGQVL